LVLGVAVAVAGATLVFTLLEEAVAEVALIHRLNSQHLLLAPLKL
jgi:hypothetical protein